jgi:DNA mismatch endonuclease (patch repair protein)
MSRSEQMSRVKGENTKPELRLRRALWARGLRYRLEVRTIGGRPDLVFLGPKVAVFVDGCFWHGCPYHYVRPRTRHEFWAGKLTANIERDRRQTQALLDDGWRVVRLWEHEVDEGVDGCVDEITRVVQGERARRQWRVVSVEVADEARDFERRTLERLQGPPDRRVYEGPRNSRSGRQLRGVLRLPSD